MKKLLLSLLLGSLTFPALAWREYDIIKGVDLSAQTNVTGSLLNQLVSAATINTNKGLVYNYATRPNVTDNPRYTNFMWFDRNTLTLKYYQGTGDSDTNWVAAIGINSISGVNIVDYSIGNTKLGTNSVLEYAISAGAVTSTKINDGQVILGKLGLGAVTNQNLAFASVTYDKIVAGTIQTTNLADSSVTSNKIAAGNITTDKLSASAITAGKIAPSTISESNIVALTITSNSIAASTINSTKLETNVTYGLARAWAVVNGSGTLLKGFNIASATRHAAGDYTVTFASGFAPTSTNYAVSGVGFTNSQALVITITTNLTTGCSYTIQNSASGAARDATATLTFWNF